MKKNRLDSEVVKRGLVLTKEEANALIMAGEIQVNGQIIYKSDKKVTESSQIEIKKRLPYVSRGAYKIKKAIEDFSVDVEGIKVLDIGISTGGFTDFLLKNGARTVVGVDVNINQVDYNLKKNNRLKLLKKNARLLKREDIDFEPDLITIDVSFISIIKILPSLLTFKNSKILSLVKPQFEAPKSEVKKGGVIKEKEKKVKILIDLKKKIEELNYSVLGCTDAGIRGRRGNQEFFFLLKYGKTTSINDKIIEQCIQNIKQQEL